jgi:hypothetical protein
VCDYHLFDFAFIAVDGITLSGIEIIGNAVSRKYLIFNGKK